MFTLRDILRPGITGTVRWARGGVTPIGDEAVRAFRTECYAAARRLNAAITRELPAEHSTSYHAIEVSPRQGGKKFEVLLHSVLPLVGARWIAPAPGEPIYVDVPWPNADVDPRLVVLPAELLNATIGREPWMKELLDPKAWADLHAWKPACLGDFVFNDYD